MPAFHTNTPSRQILTSLPRDDYVHLTKQEHNVYYDVFFAAKIIVNNSTNIQALENSRQQGFAHSKVCFIQL